MSRFALPPVLGAPLYALALVACASPRASSAPAKAANPLASAQAAPSSDVPNDVYLPPPKAGGSPFCFNPESERLRADVTRARREEGLLLDAPSLAADVGDLHAAMKKLYAGYPELLQRADFDVDRFFADWERSVARAGSKITFANGILQPLIELRHHIRDNHLSVWGWGSRLAARPELAFSEYQAHSKIERFDGATCAFGALTPVAGTVRTGRVLTRHGFDEIATFSAQSTVDAVDVICGAQTIRFERRVPHAKPRAAGTPAEPAYEWRVIGNTTVIVVRTLFGSPDVMRVLSKIASDYDNHVTKPNVVFDFRGNGGGNDGFVFDWIARAKRGTWPAPYVEVAVTGASRACGDWNDLVADQITYGTVDSPGGKSDRDAFVAKSPLGDVHALPAQMTSETSNTSSGKAPYGGRIFALVDAASASSGESAPDGLRVALGAVVVGERTGGYLEFGNVRPYAMPRTGVMWQMGTKRNYYSEPHDGVGVPVDFYLADDLMEAPLEELVPILEKLPK